MTLAYISYINNKSIYIYILYAYILHACTLKMLMIWVFQFSSFPSVQSKLQDRCQKGWIHFVHVEAASVVTKVMVPAPNLGRYQIRRGTWPIEHTIHHRIKQPAIIDEVVSYFVIINKSASSPSTSLVPPWNTAMKNTTQIDGICQNLSKQFRVPFQRN